MELAGCQVIKICNFILNSHGRGHGGPSITPIEGSQNQYAIWCLQPPRSHGRRHNTVPLLLIARSALGNGWNYIIFLSNWVHVLIFLLSMTCAVVLTWKHNSLHHVFPSLSLSYPRAVLFVVSLAGGAGYSGVFNTERLCTRRCSFHSFKRHSISRGEDLAWLFKSGLSKCLIPFFPFFCFWIFGLIKRDNSSLPRRMHFRRVWQKCGSGEVTKGRGVGTENLNTQRPLTLQPPAPVEFPSHLSLLLCLTICFNISKIRTAQGSNTHEEQSCLLCPSH